ncbi:FAD-dependent oxidoreductase [Methylobacterium organophilum]|uniref:Ferredoxin--NADP reductase n=1 Tax=Methylobacterium organophilum TaxID=410 RepID=A0ABQ4T9P6_METOR|nr:FAD-dependent oxidoreductase [Methylobacterium organophilum]GJE27605.1 Ferredoxin--NADP reductase [Methylobacterium organophilum]
MDDTIIAGVPAAQVDLKSLHGKFPAAREHVEILVVGAGPAGVAAAIEAAAHGAQVKLVDENPLSGELIGMDVPLFYGGRAGAAVHNTERMLEQVFSSNPRLEEAFEAGVDVALGVQAWGAFAPGPGAQTLPGPVVGLANETDTWLCGFDRLILAAGARDLVLFFEGVDQPGIMGAQALHALLARYDAFEGGRILILGSGSLAVQTAELALARGLTVCALVEVREAPETDCAGLAARGVEILTGHVIRAAERGPFGTTGAVLRGPDGAERRIACDTICLAVDRIPNVELLDVVGATLEFDGARGGYVPQLDGAATSRPEVFVAGDCAGLSDASPGEIAPAEAQGRLAARAALRSLGRTVEATEPAAVRPTRDRHPYRLDWMRALLAVGSPEVLACQCEEVSRGDLLGVRPPRYLGPAPAAVEKRDLGSLLRDGPVNQDQIKRLTRACMGPCQARRCREQVAMMLAIGGDRDLAGVPLAGYRAPVRPLTLGLLGRIEEIPAMREHWDVWFGIPTQWVPYADIGTPREAEYLGGNMHL